VSTLLEDFSRSVLDQEGWELTVLMLCNRFGKAKLRKDFNYILESIRDSDNRFELSHKLIMPKCSYWPQMLSKAYSYGVLCVNHYEDVKKMGNYRPQYDIHNFRIKFEVKS